MPSRREIAEAMIPYINEWIGPEFKGHRIMRHMLQLFSGQPGSRRWRRHLTEQGCRLGNGGEVIAQALDLMP